MEIIFSDVVLKQIKKLKDSRINHDVVAAMIDSLIKDENFQETLRQAVSEGSATDPFQLSFYEPEFNITITSRFDVVKNSATIIAIKRGNNMKF